MNVVVVGTGYVGLVAGPCFAKFGNKVTCVDIDKKKIDRLKKGEVPIYEPGLDDVIAQGIKENNLLFSTSLKNAMKDAAAVFIAVGTPSRKDGRADLQYVDAVAEEIGKNLIRHTVIVNKSTVPVGTGKRVTEIIKKNYKGKFDVVSNPEFLREGSAVKDFLEPDRIVVGVSSKRAKEVMLDLYEPIDAKKIVTNVESAEMIKYASNAFLATKISFINEIANICERVGADVEMVALGMGADSRIGPKFLKAGIGYGGSCFPKDVNALNQIAGTEGYDFKLLKSVIEVNNKQRLYFVDKIEETLGHLKGKTIAVMGVAFKANTDDLRESAAVDIIRMLTGLGAKVRAYDPIAIDNAKDQLGNGVKFFDDAYKAMEGADVLAITTEWPEFIELNFDKAKKILKEPYIFDGRNLLDPKKVKKSGLKYIGTGRR